MKEIVHEIVNGVVSIFIMAGVLFIFYTALKEGNKSRKNEK